ncbi:hypothetical protein JM93_01396 [Roseibium hamelinense]|uniref:Uncharacterized protein n=1 Tax=Roseibium hamelinense TaxID=150831 RepID=A0A562T9Y9_9HYPH|nr:hypothetical protein [Roseibium hamelinense]MTI45221.1 hypothetical protein [Roseibium hamelinense]TWI90415.1 hypothetical protein JM93_01396 [Roseibium hamelinense]
MLTGRQTLGSIEHALADLRREEADLGNRIERATRSVTDLQQRQGEAYRDLARFRLENHAAETLSTRLDTAAREAARLLEKRTADHKVLSEDLRKKEKQRSELQAQRDTLAKEQEAAEARMDSLMETVDAELETDTLFLEQKQRAEQAAETAEAAAKKAATSQQDRRLKGKAYEDDQLFMYLWQRGFGTPDYDKRGLVRALDGWVAKLIRFHDARANYAMLTSIPERMEKHAHRCADIAAEEEFKLAELSRAAMTRTAGEDISAKIDHLTDQLLSVDGELAALDSSIDTLNDALREFSTGSDTGYLKAEEKLSKSLKDDDLDELWRQALATPSPEDEKIVRRIEDLGERIEEFSREIRQDRELQRDISRRRGELADVAKRFRSKGYDSWETTFSDDSLTTVLLGELVKGAITGADYWARAERAYRRRRPRGGRVGFPRGAGLPKSMGGGFSGRGMGGSRSSGRFGSGGFGGGGFKSGGGFGGGGFKTGDTF